jgi:hypothetical protein
VPLKKKKIKQIQEKKRKEKLLALSLGWFSLVSSKGRDSNGVLLS